MTAPGKAATHTGKPCRKCSATLRYDSTGQCVACAKANAERQRQRRRDDRKFTPQVPA